MFFISCKIHASFLVSIVWEIVFIYQGKVASAATICLDNCLLIVIILFFFVDNIHNTISLWRSNFLSFLNLVQGSTIPRNLLPILFHTKTFTRRVHRIVDCTVDHHVQNLTGSATCRSRPLRGVVTGLDYCWNLLGIVHDSSVSIVLEILLATWMGYSVEVVLLWQVGCGLTHGWVGVSLDWHHVVHWLDCLKLRLIVHILHTSINIILLHLIPMVLGTALLSILDLLLLSFRNFGLAHL